MGSPTLFGDAAEIAAPNPPTARARPAPPAGGFVPALHGGASYPERAAAVADLEWLAENLGAVAYELLCRCLVASLYTLRRQELRRVILATIEEVKRP